MERIAPIKIVGKHFITYVKYIPRIICKIQTN